MRSLLFCGTLLAAPACALAQDDGFTCLANNPRELERHLAEHPEALSLAEQANAALEARTTGFQRGGSEPLIIPVVFHVIHDNGPENISDEQLYDAIRILNDDYNKLNPDWVNVRPEFLDIVDSVGIEFRLAKRDPEGNCTNGITRTVSSQTYDGDFEMTQLIQWPRERYMNVWVAASANGAAGYTYYPGWLDGWPEADGIVILHSYTGSIGTSAVYKSRVLSHEVGHWLNLKHCWGDSNEPGLETNCGMDDNVQDTPNTKGWTSCFLAGASCGNPLDNVQNYMEYSYCCKMFSHGQGDRMVAALTSPIAQRNNLWSAANLALTGVLEPEQLCMARFAADHREVCAGTPVSFTDLSYFGVQQWYWDFPGATPPGSFVEAPTVVYTAPGVYPVSLYVGDGTTTTSTTEPGYIIVHANPGAPTPFVEGFENATAIPNAMWSPHNPDGDNTFELSSEAAFSGTKSVRLRNQWEMAGRTDELISSTFDLSTAADISLTFRYAFARRYPENNDVLRVYASGNCGETWMLRKLMHASNTLLTGGVQPAAPFVPAGPQQWGYMTVTNLSAGLQTSSFRVKFEFYSDGGNDLWLDDINILDYNVRVEEVVASTDDLRAWPNPAADQLQVAFNLRAAERIQLDLIDPLGRTVRELASGMQAPGIRTVEVALDDLPAGLYTIRLRSAGQQQALRVVVE
ncbi:MAG: T9SS type A sorting domain-containing protein [Flavobacteriales bacterium]|nr:T9SS type A sorting domain-containing protein [Flavobacteriales bacterium]